MSARVRGLLLLLAAGLLAGLATPLDAQVAAAGEGTPGTGAATAAVMAGPRAGAIPEWSQRFGSDSPAPAVALPVLEVEAASPAVAAARNDGGASRWLMIGGGVLVAAALGDYLWGEPSFGMGPEAAVAYGVGLTAFGYGAWRATTAGAPPMVAGADRDPSR